MKSLMKMIEDVVASILRMIGNVFRMFGLGGSAGGGRQVAPKTPDKVSAQAKEAAAGKSEMSMDHKMAAAVIGTVFAYATTPAAKRKDFDLSSLTSIQAAWLRAADDKTLDRLAKLEPAEALELFVKETAMAKAAITKHLPKDIRRAIVRGNPDADREMAMKMRGPRRKQREERPRRPAPSFAMTM
ncbi:hypothetical protein [Pseudorhizobium flavum]|uniref:hypothetical protein n=1 Tax=Pseudorhizobium flavum TaxID=1335061 RepID=UPI00376FFD5C